MMTFTERVEAFVALVPAGRVVTYGDVSEALAAGTAQGVGTVMARSKGSLPWWRVVRADGGLEPSLARRAAGHWDDEGIRHADGRCDIVRHRLGVDEVLALLRRAGDEVAGWGNGTAP